MKLESVKADTAQGFKIKKYVLLGALALGLSISGCSFLQEKGKVVWGSSTKALEKARVNAIEETFSCRLEECFDTVLKYIHSQKRVGAVSLAAPNDGKISETATVKNPPLAPESLEPFIINHKKHFIVVMGVPGSVDTTEVGIFFSDRPAGTLVQISSLSSSAKLTTSNIVFSELSKSFQVSGL